MIFNFYYFLCQEKSNRPGGNSRCRRLACFWPLWPAARRFRCCNRCFQEPAGSDRATEGTDRWHRIWRFLREPMRNSWMLVLRLAPCGSCIGSARMASGSRLCGEGNGAGGGGAAAARMRKRRPVAEPSCGGACRARKTKRPGCILQPGRF